MGIEIRDLTGRLPTLDDVARAKKACEDAFLNIAHLPPALGVEIPNILRCLTVTGATLKHLRKP